MCRHGGRRAGGQNHIAFWMPLVIHNDQGREFENGLMKSLCTLLGWAMTRTAPYHPESDGMVTIGMSYYHLWCMPIVPVFTSRLGIPRSALWCLDGRATHKPATWRGATPFCNLGTGRFGSCIWSCAPFATSHSRLTEETIYTTLKQVSSGIVGAALLPSSHPKEIGISLDRPPTSMQGYRPYSGHSKGTGGPHRLYSCRRFENISTTQSFRIDPGTVDSKVAVRQHSGFPTGISR